MIISEVLSGEKPWHKYTKEDPRLLLMKNINFPIPDNILDLTIRELIIECTMNSPLKRCNTMYIKKKLFQVLYRSLVNDSKTIVRDAFDFNDKQCKMI